MPKRVTKTKREIAREIVDIDVALCRKNLTPEERKDLQTQRDRLERRLYR